MGVSQMIIEWIRRLFGVHKPKSKEEKPVIIIDNREGTEIDSYESAESNQLEIGLDNENTKNEPLPSSEIIVNPKSQQNHESDRMEALIKEMDEIKQRLNEKETVLENNAKDAVGHQEMQADKAASTVIEKDIEALKQPDQLLHTDDDTVIEDKTSYDKLNDTQKSLVPEEKVSYPKEMGKNIERSEANVQEYIEAVTTVDNKVNEPVIIAEPVTVAEPVEKTQQSEMAARKLNVLIVDDAAFMRTILRKIIEELGEYNIVGEATNGHEALIEVQKSMPDIITMDITMPDMDGITAVKKALEIHPRAKIIMCTAVNQKTMFIQAIKNGAKDFITKPFDKAQVAEALKSVASL